MDFQRHFLAMWRRILSAASCHSLALVPVFLGRLFSKFCDFSQPLNWYPPPLPPKNCGFYQSNLYSEEIFSMMYESNFINQESSQSTVRSRFQGRSRFYDFSPSFEKIVTETTNAYFYQYRVNFRHFLLLFLAEQFYQPRVGIV